MGTRDDAQAPQPTAAEADRGPLAARSSGLLPSQEIRALVTAGAIAGVEPIGEDQIQPASLDLRLDAVAHRVRASFLPGSGATVLQRIDEFGMHRFELGSGAVLEKGCVYIVPLMESLNLKGRLSGFANPKSSTGRLDVFTRLIADHGAVFDQVPAGYHGPLYAEISPRTFSIVVRRGSRLSQLRLRRGSAETGDSMLKRLQREVRVVDAAEGAADIDQGIAVTVDLSNGIGGGIVGWRARHHTGLIDLNLIDHYEVRDFWEPVRADTDGAVVLNPGDFYILASKEAVTVPPDHAAEMRAYDTRVGEFRVHYAGFFDPGFGFAATGGTGSRAVLEIRSFEVPFVLRDGQLVGRLVYERMTETPDKLYGTPIGSSYQRQSLALAKQFRRPDIGSCS
ncbi:MAG: 2'-deoxycytidine 5'-triphosphate deaminase [Defluviicoccus sp.]|nr:2'-deoxycytidine 5'-triphosphate deaminase [Defluviicoccus sp.]MDG4593567.1 2'-deoxycytidine 5'-triphosphate deaminase [Defluviicoccus sp.]